MLLIKNLFSIDLVYINLIQNLYHNFQQSIYAICMKLSKSRFQENNCSNYKKHLIGAKMCPECHPKFRIEFVYN